MPGRRRLRSLAVRRTRVAVIATCAVALGAGACFAAPAPSAVSAESRSMTERQATASSLATAPAARAIDADLDAGINEIIDANSAYQVGVALLDLSDGAAANQALHTYGVDAAFVAASTAKVLAAEAFYHLVETGGAILGDQMGEYTAEFQLQAMIQQSDNDSWSLITDSVGHEQLTDYAASMGVDYSPEVNTLTPADMAHVLAGLFSGTLLDPANTSQLLGYMQETNYESLIPAAVPAGIAVFHKYGVLDGELHDAAIFARDGTAYALVVYNQRRGPQQRPGADRRHPPGDASRDGRLVLGIHAMCSTPPQRRATCPGNPGVPR